MAAQFIKVFQQASDLPKEDRELLTDLLLDTLGAQVDPEIEAAWHAELDRRVAELQSGAVKGRPWEEVCQELRARLHAKKKRKTR